MFARIRYTYLSALHNAKQFIIPDNAVQITNEYIAKIKTPIRFFATHGQGFGDQVALLNILDNLENFKGPVEIIGDYNPKDPEFAMNKLLKLCNIYTPFIDGKLTAQLSTGREVTFISLENFFKHEYPEAQLGIYVGISEAVEYSYNPMHIFFPKKIPDFAQIGKVKDALIFDPFTANTVSNNKWPGFATQSKNHPLYNKPWTNILPYKLLNPTSATITKELHNFYQKSPGKAAIVETVLNAKTENAMYLLAPYGLKHTTFYPEYAVFNQIIAAAKASSGDKPITMMTLNHLSYSSWEALRQLFQSNYTGNLAKELNWFKENYVIHFIDPTNNKTQLSLLPKNFNIVNMGEVPNKLFNEIIAQSDFLPTFEGANLGTFLLNRRKPGIPCTRPGWTTSLIGHDSSYDILSAASDACAENLKDWEISPNPAERLSNVYLTYQNATLPPPLEPDRFSYAVMELERKKTAPSALAFFKPSENLAAISLVHLTSAIEYGIYGFIEQTAQEVFLNNLDMSASSARLNANILRILLQYQHSDLSTGNLLCILISVGLMKIYNKEWLALFPMAYLAFSAYTSDVLEYDPEKIILLVSLLITSLVSENLTKKIVHSFFQPPTIEQQEEVQAKKTM